MVIFIIEKRNLLLENDIIMNRSCENCLCTCRLQHTDPLYCVTVEGKDAEEWAVGKYYSGASLNVRYI